MAPRCLKAKPQGGQMLWYSSRGIAAGLMAVLCLAGGNLAESRPRSSAGEVRKWQATCSGMLFRSRCCIYQQGAKGNIWSQTLVIFLDSYFTVLLNAGVIVQITLKSNMPYFAFELQNTTKMMKSVLWEVPNTLHLIYVYCCWYFAI